MIADNLARHGQPLKRGFNLRLILNLHLMIADNPHRAPGVALSGYSNAYFAHTCTFVEC